MTAGVLGAGDVPRWLGALVAVAVVAGIGLRVAFVVLPGTSALDSDEAITGLMALHALRDGRVDTFFWGQAYGGSLEPLLAAPLFAVTGPSLLALRAVPMALSAVAALLVWRVGRATVGERAGLVAAAAMWSWPAAMVWFSTKGRGFYWVCLVAGLAFLLLALRLARDPHRPVEWLALGLAGGIGWWSSPQILYFAVPGTIWLVLRLRGEAWRLALAFPAAVVGAAPWLAFNLRNGLLSLEAGDRANDRGLLGNLWVLASEGLPVILGLEVGGRPLIPLLVPLGYLALVAVVAVRVARRPDGAGPVLLAAATFPGIYAVFPVSGVVGEGRYLLFLLPVLALLIAHAAATPAAQGAFLAVAVALSVAGVPRLEGGTAPLALDQLVPDDLDPVLAELERRGVDTVVTDYWLAYRIAFETEEAVIATPITHDRYPAYTEAVLSDEDGPAWVFVAGTSLLPTFEAELARRGVEAERVDTGGFVLYFPDERVVCWPTDPQVGVPCG